MTTTESPVLDADLLEVADVKVMKTTRRNVRSDQEFANIER